MALLRLRESFGRGKKQPKRPQSICLGESGSQLLRTIEVHHRHEWTPSPTNVIADVTGSESPPYENFQTKKFPLSLGQSPTSVWTRPKRRTQFPKVAAKEISGYWTDIDSANESMDSVSSDLVFLQYQEETKRAFLSEQLISFDQLQRLFVRTFSGSTNPNRLTDDYFRLPHVKIYIQDATKIDVFYELEDLKDVKDRAVLKVHDQKSGHAATSSLSVGDATGSRGRSSSPSVNRPSDTGLRSNGAMNPRPPVSDDMNYFSEPEIDSDTLGRRKRVGYYDYINSQRNGNRRPPNQIGGQYPQNQSLFSDSTQGAAAAPPKPGRNFAPLTMQDSTRSEGPTPPARMVYPPGSAPKPGRELLDVMSYARDSSEGRNSYASSERSLSLPRSGSMTPVIDEEARVRVENMEKQLANLSNLVHAALMNQTVNKTVHDAVYRDIETLRRDIFNHYDDTASETGSTSRFSDLSSEKGSFVDRGSATPERNLFRYRSLSQGRGDAMFPQSFGGGTPTDSMGGGSNFTAETKQQLRQAKRKTNELQSDLRHLRRLAQVNAQASRSLLKDTFDRIRMILNTNKQLELFAVQTNDAPVEKSGSGERNWVNSEQDRYRGGLERIDGDLRKLEVEVESLRENVVNGKHKLRVSEVEDFTEGLTNVSKIAAALKTQFPHLQNKLKNVMTVEMDKVVRDEKFLKEEPEKIDAFLKRCKKVTNTLVTMKKLAIVQDPGSFQMVQVGGRSIQSSSDSAFGSSEGSNNPKGSENGYAVPVINQSLPPESMQPPPKPSAPADAALITTGTSSGSTTPRKASGSNAAMLDSILEELQTVADAKTPDENGESLKRSKKPVQFTDASREKTPEAVAPLSLNSPSYAQAFKANYMNDSPANATVPVQIATAKTYQAPIRHQAYKASVRSHSETPEPHGPVFGSTVPVNATLPHPHQKQFVGPTPLHITALGRSRSAVATGRSGFAASFGNTGYAADYQRQMQAYGSLPRSRSGTPNSITSEPPGPRSWGGYGAPGAPAPPPRSSSRNMSMSPRNLQQSHRQMLGKYNNDDIEKFKTQLLTDFYGVERGYPEKTRSASQTPVPSYRTYALDDEILALKQSMIASGSSTESVNSQDGARIRKSHHGHNSNAPPRPPPPSQ